MDACGGLEDWDGETEPESKKSSLCWASWLIRDETSRLRSRCPGRRARGTRVGAAGKDGDDPEAHRRRTHRGELHDVRPAAGGREAGGGGAGGHASMKATCPGRLL